jgi:hypothetical protein
MRTLSEFVSYKHVLCYKTNHNDAGLLQNAYLCLHTLSATSAWTSVP